MEWVRNWLQTIFFRTRPSSREQTMSIYWKCELLHLLAWLFIASSFLFTGGRSLTFRPSGLSEYSLHCYFHLGLLCLSLAVKLILLALCYCKQYTFRKTTFCVLTLTNDTLSLLDKVVATEFLSFVSSCWQPALLTMIALAVLVLGPFMRLLNELFSSSYLLTNQAPSKRLPNYWNAFLSEALPLSVFFLFGFLPKQQERGILALTNLTLIAWTTAYITVLPYFVSTVASKKLMQWAVSSSLLVCMVLDGIPILHDNMDILYVLMGIFSCFFSINYYFHQRNVMKWVMQELIFKRLETIQHMEQAVSRLHHLSSVLRDEDDSLGDCVNAVMRDHRGICKDPSCVCRKSPSNSLETAKSSDISFNPVSSTRVYYRYFLLSESELCRSAFPDEIPCELTHLSAVALVGLYPRLLSECHQLEARNELSFRQRFELGILREQCVQELLKGVGSPNHLNVQLFREHEQAVNQLTALVEQSINNKCRLWRMLQGNVHSYDQVEGVLAKEVGLSDRICSLYAQMLEHNLESAKVSSLLIGYTRLVSQNPDLHNSIKERCRLESLQGSSKIGSSSNMRAYFDTNKCGSLRISTSKGTFGRVEWCSQTINTLYSGESCCNLQSQNLSVLLPEELRASHQRTMLEWFEAPASGILQRKNNFVMELRSGVVRDVVVHVRLLPLKSDIELYALLEWNTNNEEYILLDEELTVINRPKCLASLLKTYGFQSREISSAILRAEKSSRNDVDFRLLSTDFTDFNWESFQADSWSSIEFELRWSSQYYELRSACQQAINELRRRNELAEAEVSVRKYYASLLESAPEEHYERFSGGMRLISWSSGRRFVALRVQKTTDYKPEPSFLMSSLHCSQPSSNLRTVEDTAVAAVAVQSGSTMTQTNMRRNITKELKHVLLRKLNILLVLLLALFCIMFALRSSLTSALLQSYNTNMDLDSGASDIMQLAELIYDYTLLLKHQANGGAVANKAELFSLNKYILDFCVLRLASDSGNGSPVNYRQIVQQTNYLQVEVPVAFTGNFVNSEIFLSVLVVQAFEVLGLLGEFVQIGNTTLLLAVEHSFKPLFDSYPALAALNQHTLDVFQETGSGIIRMLTLLCWVMLPTNFLCSLAVVWLVARYQQKTREYFKQLIELFGTVEPAQLVAQRAFYEKLQKEGLSEDFEAPLTQTASQWMRKCTFMEKPRSRYRWWHLLMLVMFALCEVVCCIETFRLMPVITRQLTDMNTLLQTENYQIEALIELNELATHTDQASSGRFRGAASKINTAEVEFVQNAVTLLGGFPQNDFAGFQQILTTDICDLASGVLLPEQYEHCVKSQSNISSSGVLATMAYSQRLLQEAYSAVRGGAAFPLTMGTLDTLFFYQFRIFQLIQGRIIEQSNKRINRLTSTLNYAYIANILFLAIVVGCYTWFSLEERKKNSRRHRYLLSLPSAELKHNKHVARYVSQVNEQSLLGSQ